MPHTIEPAASGRAKCRGCGEKIAKGELRLGARLPSPFDEELELTLWFHLVCGAFKRPDAYLEAAAEFDGTIEDLAALEVHAKKSLEFSRLSRLDGASRAPTGRAVCRSCKESIEKGSWRIALVYYDEVEGRFNPAGYLHPKCTEAYFGTIEVMDRVEHFASNLEPSDFEEIRTELASL